jgi:hypothetical protein
MELDDDAMKIAHGYVHVAPFVLRMFSSHDDDEVWQQRIDGEAMKRLPRNERLEPPLQALFNQLKLGNAQLIKDGVVHIAKLIVPPNGGNLYWFVDEKYKYGFEDHEWIFASFDVASLQYFWNPAWERQNPRKQEEEEKYTRYVEVKKAYLEGSHLNINHLFVYTYDEKFKVHMYKRTHPLQISDDDVQGSSKGYCTNNEGLGEEDKEELNVDFLAPNTNRYFIHERSYNYIPPIPKARSIVQRARDGPRRRNRFGEEDYLWARRKPSVEPRVALFPGQSPKKWPP